MTTSEERTQTILEALPLAEQFMRRLHEGSQTNFLPTKLYRAIKWQNVYYPMQEKVEKLLDDRSLGGLAIILKSLVKGNLIPERTALSLLVICRDHYEGRELAWWWSCRRG